jgi:hypothetical protein
MFGIGFWELIIILVVLFLPAIAITLVLWLLLKDKKI